MEALLELKLAVLLDKLELIISQEILTPEQAKEYLEAFLVALEKAAWLMVAMIQ
jgi:hypothetical protein